MRTVGMIEYITPRQIATASSNTPKSVMKTIVGGYFSPGSALAARTNEADSARSTMKAAGAALRQVRRRFARRARIAGIPRSLIQSLVPLKCRLAYRGCRILVHHTGGLICL